jgi:hypothetical protein
MGFTAMAGFEYEFYVFRETPASALAKGYRNLTTLNPTTGGYSALRMAVEDGFFSGMMQLAHQLETPLEAIHPEAGEGATEYRLHALRGAGGRRPGRDLQDVLAGLGATERANAFATWQSRSMACPDAADIRTCRFGRVIGQPSMIRPGNTGFRKPPAISSVAS